MKLRTTPRRRKPQPGEDSRGWMFFRHAGELFLPELEPSDVLFEDLVHGLGQINRYLGQTRSPVSVLWHSLAVARLCRKDGAQTELAGLFHDAGEAYVGDWITPLIEFAGLELRKVRRHVQKTCYEAAGATIDRETLESVKRADELALRYEMTAAWGYGRRASWHAAATREEWLEAEREISHLQAELRQRMRAAKGEADQYTIHDELAEDAVLKRETEAGEEPAKRELRRMFEETADRLMPAGAPLRSNRAHSN